MKKILLTVCVVAASVGATFGQGRVLFNNLVSGNIVTITGNASFAHAGQGAAGANVGATYSAALSWAPQAAYANLAAFQAAALGTSAATAFFGTTGGSAGSDGAGLVDGGTVAVTPAGAYTMVAYAFYNVGAGNSTYAGSLANGNNTGASAFFNLSSTASPTPAPNTPFGSFTVQVVPEPGTLALLGLGAASLALIRRRK